VVRVRQQTHAVDHARIAKDNPDDV
jgi:hypothetical protein